MSKFYYDDDDEDEIDDEEEVMRILDEFWDNFAEEWYERKGRTKTTRLNPIAKSLRSPHLKMQTVPNRKKEAKHDRGYDNEYDAYRRGYEKA